MTAAELIAAGWSPFSPVGFSAALGALWEQGAGIERRLGFIADVSHCNGHQGTVHGGALMTLADMALGYRLALELAAPHCATVQLQLHFVAAAHPGEFVECRAELLRRTRQLAFLRGLICVGDRVVSSADGVWKIFAPTSTTSGRSAFASKNGDSP